MREKVRERESEREKERDRSPQQWTTVQRRKTSHQNPQAKRTCFVDCLPTDVTIGEVEKLFSPYGTITNIFIPKVLRTKHRLHYAFVQFQSDNSLQLVTQRENGRRYAGAHLRIFAARKDWMKPSPYLKSTHPKPPANPPCIQSLPQRQQNRYASFRP